MASTTTMGLSQMVIGSTYQAGHTLDVIFALSDMRDGLKIGVSSTHFLVMVRPFSG